MNRNGHRNGAEFAASMRYRRPTSPPLDLDDASKRFWRRTLGQLRRQGTWQDMDIPLLERYVRACQAARQWREKIPSDGTTRGSQGQLVEHPLIRTVREAERDATRYAEALLLMPADRRRYGLDERPEDVLPSWLDDREEA